MLSNVSWFEYLVFISVSALLWYAAVFYIYYRHDLLRALQAKKIDPSGNGKINSVYAHEQSFFADKNSQTSDTEREITQSFSDEVQAYLSEAGKDETVKDELITSLCKIARKYPAINSPAFKASLNRFIINQTETYCAMSLSEEDLNKVWGST